MRRAGPLWWKPVGGIGGGLAAGQVADSQMGATRPEDSCPRLRRGGGGWALGQKKLSTGKVLLTIFSTGSGAPIGWDGIGALQVGLGGGFFPLGGGTGQVADGGSRGRGFGRRLWDVECLRGWTGRERGFFGGTPHFRDRGKKTRGGKSGKSSKLAFVKFARGGISLRGPRTEKGAKRWYTGGFGNQWTDMGKTPIIKNAKFEGWFGPD